MNALLVVSLLVSQLGLCVALFSHFMAHRKERLAWKPPPPPPPDPFAWEPPKPPGRHYS